MLPAIGKRKTFDPTHWMTLRLRADNAKLRLFLTVCPTGEPGERKRLVDRVLRSTSEFGFVKFYKEPTKEWTTLLSDEICALPDDEELDTDVVIDKVERRLIDFLTQTAALPAAVKSLYAPA